MMTRLYWKGAFVRKKGKRASGISHFLTGIMAIGKTGFYYSSICLIIHLKMQII